MKIRLKRTWFAPDISGVTSKKYIGRNGRVLARGHRLLKGIHEVPDEWLPRLPSDAQVLEGGYKLEDDEMEYAPVEGDGSLANQLGPEAAAATAAVIQLGAITETAEAKRAVETKANRRAGAERARAAKKLKEENANA